MTTLGLVTSTSTSDRPFSVQARPSDITRQEDQRSARHGHMIPLAVGQPGSCVFVSAPVAAAIPTPAPTAAAATIVQNHQRV